MKQLAKYQTCGCVVCDCDSDYRCLGCGAKSCNTKECFTITGKAKYEKRHRHPLEVALLREIARQRGLRRNDYFGDSYTILEALWRVLKEGRK